MKIKTINELIKLIDFNLNGEIPIELDDKHLNEIKALLLLEKQRKLKHGYNPIQGFREKKRKFYELIYPSGKVVGYTEIIFTDKPKNK